MNRVATRIISYTFIALCMSLYIYIFLYAKDHPEYMMYDSASVDYVEGVAPTKNCSYEFNDLYNDPTLVTYNVGGDYCTFSGLPLVEKDIYVKIDNPFVYYSSKYSWLMLVVAILWFCSDYLGRGGIKRLKSHTKAVRTFFDDLSTKE